LWCCKKTVDGILTPCVVPGVTPDLEPIDRLCESLKGSDDSPRVIVDLSAIDVASNALAARIVALHKRIPAAKGKLVLGGLNQVTRDTCYGCRLDRILDICDDQEAALARL
jgi:anti-anti-sigma regulatory factor